MKNVYVQPRVEIVAFAPSRAIAMEDPDWGWEEDVFSTPEARSADDEDAGRRGLHED